VSRAAQSPSPPRRCPICGKPADERWRPFCSKRCADVDLNRWLGGHYHIETDEAPSEKSPSDSGDRHDPRG
jgi:endogenous inhibitor of DNA gyrase (YacG/DUF329 family)